MAEQYRINNDGEYIYIDDHNRYVKAEACSPCCGGVILNCTEWDALCNDDPPIDVNVEAIGSWFEAGATSCFCPNIPQSVIINTTCQALFNKVEAESSPLVTICSHNPNLLKGSIWVRTTCSSGVVTITIRQCSATVGQINHTTGTISLGNPDYWAGFHEWEKVFAPPFSLGTFYYIPWKRRVEAMTPSGLFVPIGCRPQNATQPDARIALVLA